jgi:hypothetical protein
MSIALESSKVKKVLHILISTFRHIKLLAGEHKGELSFVVAQKV